MEQKIIDKIKSTNQKYLLPFVGEDIPARLEKQLEEMDWSNLDAIHNKEQKRGKFSPLGAMELSEIEANKEKYTAVGIDAIKKCKVGAILLAGGQGTRLGFDKAKGMYNIGETKELYIFEQLVENLKKVTTAADAWVLQGYEALVLLSHHTTLLYECGVDIHLSYVVDDDGKFYTLLIAEYAIEQCGLSAAEVSCQQQHR